jgi:hypothetical protein
MKHKGGQPYNPTGYPTELTGMGKTPHKSLIIRFEVKLDGFQICPKFLEAKKHCETFQHIGRIFPFLLSKCPGSERYWLAFALKLLEQNCRNARETASV